METLKGKEVLKEAEACLDEAVGELVDTLMCLEFVKDNGQLCEMTLDIQTAKKMASILISRLANTDGGALMWALEDMGEDPNNDDPSEW
jgi:hypothetical protein